MTYLSLAAVVVALLATLATTMVRDDRRWKREMEQRMRLLEALERITDGQ